MNKWILFFIYLLATMLEIQFEGFKPTQFEQAMIAGILLLIIRD